MLLIPAVSRAEALSKVKLFQRKDDIEAAAGSYWNSWMAAGQLPAFKDNDAQAVKYLEAYKRNLFCVKSANLNGQIPADITGQFVTNGMPQIYPRDALMCARVLLLTGHAEEAKQLIEFWARPQVPMKTPGEWYYALVTARCQN
jgi:GH15 family glucan-1,4-alpha-glucosidase